VDDGWTVASRLLVHERLSVGGGSPYTSGRSGGHDAEDGSTLVDLVRASGREHEPRARQLLAEAHARRVVHRALNSRLTSAMAAGAMPPPAGAIMKLFAATNVMRRTEIGLELAGPEAVVWPDGPDLSVGAQLGTATLGRQGLSLGGGSNEMQRNIISERVLGLPREMAADRDVPYREVRRTGGR
jgi:alkylation response protein AidB-like acyl-CoA dehydrogenase